jgi:hypothetical protein
MTAPQQAATPSEPNAQVAALAPIAAPQIIARIDDGVSSIQNDSATQPSTSSKFRSNAAEPAPDVSVAQPHARLAAATVNASPIPLPPRAPADLVSDRRETISLIDEPIGDAGTRVRPFHLILAFVVALVGMLYYVVFRYLPVGSAQIGIDHPEDDYADDDPYNNPEFYRQLRQGAVPEKP